MNLWQRLVSLARRGRVALGHYLVGGKLPSARATDSAGEWDGIRSGSGPADRGWADLSKDMEDSLEAWRKNFLIRQVVRLTTAYVVGDGIKLSSDNPTVNEFITQFCTHPENRIGSRLPALCDEWTRSGELFPVLFTNKISGMSQTRFVPASCIESVETDPEDYEKETGYNEIIPNQIERKPWLSRRTARTFSRRNDNRHRRPDPMMLHYSINKPVGATRGEGDLTPVLPWAKRYTEWLKDRVSLNRLRTELSAVDIEIDDDAKVTEWQVKYEAKPPLRGAINVHGRGHKVTYPTANIQAYDAEPDGRAIRLAFAAGANIPLHFLAEGSSATRSTATEMGDPTHRHYRMRQKDFTNFLVDLCEQAWRRYELVLGLTPLDDLQIKAEAPDVSRADNKALADAALTLVNAFATMKQNGWIDDKTAVELAFKFAGEILPEGKIDEILKGNNSNASKNKEEGKEGEEEGLGAIRRNGNGNTDSLPALAPGAIAK